MGDRGDLSCVVGEGLLEGREEVLRENFGKRRRLERRRLRHQKRVCLSFASRRRLLGV